jgi:cytidylate kinase
MQKKITIAIDGFSSCGKSTLAKALANKLDYVFIDTGAMYRAVAYYCLQKGFISNQHLNKEEIVNSLNEIEIHFEKNDVTKKLDVFLNDLNIESKIRTLEISELVSKIASIKEVRQKLVAEQQKMGIKGGVVMDGRDIGSVVFPSAELKFFVTASPEIRTERRFLELKPTEPEITKEEVKKNLVERDHLDSTRAESPLIQVDDAIVIDNSNLNQEEQLELALKYVQERLI